MTRTSKGIIPFLEEINKYHKVREPRFEFIAEDTPQHERKIPMATSFQRVTRIGNKLHFADPTQMDDESADKLQSNWAIKNFNINTGTFTIEIGDFSIDVNNCSIVRTITVITYYEYTGKIIDNEVTDMVGVAAMNELLLKAATKNLTRDEVYRIMNKYGIVGESKYTDAANIVEKIGFEKFTRDAE